MINTTDILTAWQRIGWLEPSKTGYTDILDTDNKTTLSSKTFDALHPLTNFVKFKDTYSDKDASDAVLNAQLKAWQQTGIVDVMSDVFKDRDMITNKTILSGGFDFSETLAGSGKFVFVKVVVPQGFVVNLKSVGITLDGIDTFNFYVFNSSVTAALVTNKSVTSVANTEVWTSWNYNLWGESLDLKSGIYYIGYFQDDVSSDAIQRTHYKQNDICGIDYCTATPNGTYLPEYDTIIYSGYTHGINLDYSVSADFSHYFINNPSVFDTALSYYVIIKCLTQIMLSERFNASQRAADDAIDFASQVWTEINGARSEETYSKGMNKMYYDEIKNIKDILFKKDKIYIVTIK